MWSVRKMGCVILSLSMGLLSRAEMASVDNRFEGYALRGLAKLYNFEFEKAREDFDSLIATYPDHPGGYFLRAFLEWQGILLDVENKSYDQAFHDYLDKTEDAAEKRLEENEGDYFGLLFLGGSAALRARLQVNRGEWVSAVNNGRIAYTVLRKLWRAHPGSPDVIFATGMYHYYAAVAPLHFAVVKPFMTFFPEGDKERGIEELTYASERGRFTSVEAMYFLAQLFLYFEGDPSKALSLAEELHKRYPKNSLFYLYIGRSLAHLGRNDEAKLLLSDILQHVEVGESGYNRVVAREAYFLRGICEMSLVDHDLAISDFNRCIELSTESDKHESSYFSVFSHLRMGMIHDLRGSRSEAAEEYRKVLEMKNEGDAHEQARRYLEKGYGSD